MKVGRHKNEGWMKSADNPQSTPLTAYNCNNQPLKTGAEMARAGTINRHE
jgi:hypothetical protein